MTIPLHRPMFDWEGAGRDLAETTKAYHAIVVIGNNPVATGRVAVGLARAEAAHRRVALGDLFAESPPIQALVQSDDPHGLVDCFLYGVSITKIAHQVPGAGELFVMPSGTDTPPYEEMLASPRWQRLTAGFREMGALLILAAPASAPRLADLIAATDGAVLVGETSPGSLPDIPVLGAVREPRPITGPRRTPVAAPKSSRISKRQMASIAGVVLAAALAGTALWLAYRPMASSPRPRRAYVADSSKPGAAAARIVPAFDSITRDSTGGAAAAAAGSALRIANPGDSANIAAFAVELMATNSQADAIFKLQKDGKNLPAATFAPALIQGGAWFKVVTGAFSERTGADSLLAGLGRRKLLLGGESVVKLPYAFLIDSGVPAAAVPGMVTAFIDRGQPVYALRQANGSAWLLIGAFASIEQSSLYTQSLRASGIVPVLVFRKGRMF